MPGACMTTYATNNPLGSTDPRDLYDNAQNLDHLSNDQVNESWPDRFGNPRKTWHGIEVMATEAIEGYGWILIDSFQTGATLTLPNQALRDTVTGEYYRWDGSFPKDVPANSTPGSTGGTGIGAWVSIGDAGLRSQLASSTGYKLVPSINVINSVVPVEIFRASGLTDQQIVQQANDYAASVGRDLLFQEGITYQVESVTATCKWIRPNLKRKPATTSNMVVISNGGSLIGGSVDGSADTLSSAANTIYVNSTSRFDIDGTHITNTPGHAIVVQDTPNTFAPSRIKVTTVVGGSTSSSQASAGSGIYLYNALNVDIIDNDISKKANGVLGQGNKRNSAKLNISRNRTYQNYGSGIGLVLISEAADQQAYEKVLITENHIFNNSGTGLAVQCDLTVVTNNQVHGNGSETYHQGILVNANGVSVNSNNITNNAGVGIDFGDCRKCSATGNHIEENGWLGIEVNSCEQMTVTCNILNLNLKGKSDGPMQAAILVHKGNGGYPFLGDSKDITITGNSIRSGDGQIYAIFIADVNCYNITVSANACKLAGLLDDIVTVSGDVRIFGNDTRWDPMGSARASISSGVIGIPSVADTVQVNGTGSVVTINIQNGGAYIKDRYVRILSINGMTLENSGGAGGNLYLGASIVLAAGDSVRLWSDGSGGWKKA